jgi:quinoprotein glucose dehydrogenase
LSLGHRQYLVHCAACHGAERRGDPRGGMPALDRLKSQRTPEQVMNVIRQGGGRMPPFDRLGDRQRAAIVGYLFGSEAPAGNAGPASTDDKTEEPPYAFGGFQRWFDREGYPAIKPPWGTLNAVDMNSGALLWKVPLGEYPELTARGIPPTGTENYGGPVVTAGGLIFIAASADETIRAFDRKTGKVLWQARLPFSGNATPSTYMANGRQYVVISAGGGKSGRPAGGTLVAFALPD